MVSYSARWRCAYRAYAIDAIKHDVYEIHGHVTVVR